MELHSLSVRTMMGERMRELPHPGERALCRDYAGSRRGKSKRKLRDDRPPEGVCRNIRTDDSDPIPGVDHDRSVFQRRGSRDHLRVGLLNLGRGSHGQRLDVELAGNTTGAEAHGDRVVPALAPPLRVPHRVGEQLARLHHGRKQLLPFGVMRSRDAHENRVELSLVPLTLRADAAASLTPGVDQRADGHHRAQESEHQCER